MWAEPESGQTGNEVEMFALDPGEFVVTVRSDIQVPPSVFSRPNGDSVASVLGAFKVTFIDAGDTGDHGSVPDAGSSLGLLSIGFGVVFVGLQRIIDIELIGNCFLRRRPS